MENSLSVLLSRQGVLNRQMEFVASNLANANTAGFKAESLIFTESPEPTSRHEQPLSMVHDVTYLRDMSEGTISATENPLDLAISGDGFFAVQAPQGQRYTRHGAFQLDSLGQIVTLRGAPVLGIGGAPIVVPPRTSAITITRDGTVSADAAQIGKIQVVAFDTPQALSKDGDDLYDPKDQAPRPATNAHVLQGMIEGSNVKGVMEMTRMIDVVRSYQHAVRMTELEHKRILDAIDVIVGNS